MPDTVVIAGRNYDDPERPAQAPHVSALGALRIGGDPDNPADILTYALISDAVSRPVRADASTHALEIIEYAHHEIHAGCHFYVKDVTDLGGTATYNLLFVTPNTPTYVHLFFDFWHEQEMVFVVTEDVTVDANGTPVTPVNNNRNSAKVPTMSVFHTPTNPAGGTVIYSYQTGAGKQGGGEKRAEDELVLKRDTLYLVRATNAVAGNCLYDYHFKWYEHQDKG